MRTCICHEAEKCACDCATNCTCNCSCGPLECDCCCGVSCFKGAVCDCGCQDCKAHKPKEEEKEPEKPAAEGYKLKEVTTVRVVTAAQVRAEQELRRDLEEGKKGHSMETKKFTTVAKNELKSAAVRTASLQAVKKAKTVIAAAMSRKLAPGNKSMRKKIVELLDSPFGDAIVAAALSVFITPMSTYDTNGTATNSFAKVATELRVTALTITADKTIDAITDPMMAVVSSFLSEGDARKVVAGVRVALEEADKAGNSEGAEAEAEEQGHGHDHAHEPRRTNARAQA